MTDPAARASFRALTRHRGGYEGIMFDVQLLVVRTGALVWSQSFSDQHQADGFHRQLEEDLEELDVSGFRSKYGVPSSS